MPDSDLTNDRLTRLLFLFEQYQNLRLEGNPVAFEDLCSGDIDCIPRLQLLIDAERRLSELASINLPDCLTVSSDNLIDTLPPPEAVEGITEPVPEIDRYEIISRLGIGGMGVVYHARDRLLHRDVALKVLRAEVLTQGMRQRFLLEARAVATLDHPNIVKIYDVGEWKPVNGNSLTYLAIEYVSGGTLIRHLQGSPIPPYEAAHLIRILARAMAHAHARGIVHRDLKPDNVLLASNVEEPKWITAYGCPKISDFGLAQSDGIDQRLTQTGTVMGTPAYMAPEQAEGETETVGPPADVWALGVMLYQMLSGKLPFLGSSTLKTLRKITEETPQSLSLLNPSLPSELIVIVQDCLHKQSECRPAADQLADRLDAFLDNTILRSPSIASSLHRDSLENDTEVMPKHSLRRFRVPQQITRVLATLAVSGVGIVLLIVSLFPIFGPRTITPNKEINLDKVVNALSKPVPVTIEPIVVEHFKTIGDEAEQCGRIGMKSQYTTFGDAVTIHVHFKHAAYCFLLGFNFNGEEQLLWPVNAMGMPDRNRAPVMIKSLLFPGRENRLYLDEDNAKEGLQCYAVVASSKPLPSYEHWRQHRGEVGWHRYPPGSKVWEADDLRTYESVLEKGTGRGKIMETKDPVGAPPLTKLCRSLRVGGVEQVEAIAFPVLPKTMK